MAGIMRVRYFCLGALLQAFVTGVLAKDAGKSEAAIERPSLPPISSIELQPAKLTLRDARDARQILVWGKTEDGRKVDLTSDAKFACESEAVAIDADRYISA